MATIFDALDSDVEKFLSAAEELFPGFQDRITKKLSEDADAQLLQEEQNLSEDIKKQEDLVQELIQKLSNYRYEVDENIKKMQNDINGAQDALDWMNEKRVEIHKKWIALHPAKTEVDKHVDNIINNAQEAGCGVMKKSTEKLDLHKAFDIFYCDHFQFLTESPDHTEYYKKMFKRFDNLVHGRCKSTSLFELSWMLNDISAVISKLGHPELAKSLEDFNNFCIKQKYDSLNFSRA